MLNVETDKNFRTWFGNEIIVKKTLLPTSQSELIAHLKRYRNYKNLRVFGSTSNVFFPHKHYQGPLIFTTNLPEDIDFKTGWVGAGTLTERLSMIAASAHYTGFEGIEGIPGTIGGAIAMNASAYGCALSHNLIEVLVYDIYHDKTLILSQKELNFTDRSSRLLKERNLVLISARFTFIKGDITIIRKNRLKFHHARHSYSDYTLPSLGSTFIQVTGNMNNELLSYVRGTNPYNVSLLIQYIILRCYNSRLLTMVRRGVRWNPYNWIFRKYLKRYMRNPNSKSYFTMNTIMNNQNDIEAAIEHIQDMQKCLPDYKLENEIYYEN